MEHIRNTREKTKKIIIRICNFFDYVFKESIFRKIFQFFPNNIFLFILSIVVIFTCINKIQSNVSYYTNGFVGYKDEFTKGNEIVQDVNVDRVDSIGGIGFKTGTYNRENDSNYELTLYEDDKIIFHKKFNAKGLKDNEYNCLDTGNIKVNKNSKYKIVLKSLDAKKENAIAIGYSSFNDEKYALAISNPSEFNGILKITFILFLTILFIINYLINNNKIKENKFLLLMLIYMVPVLFIIPPQDIPDEGYHFNVSYSISQYDFSMTPIENSKRKVLMPSNINCISKSYINQESYLKTEDITDCFKSSAKNEYRKILTPSYNASIAYLPSAIGIKIADFFTNSPLIIFYSGRLFNFIVSFLILLYAFKILPKYKNIFLIVICIPMFIQQMISYSYDSILNSLCILVFAMIIKFYNSNEKISKKDLIVFAVSSLIIYIIKAPYVLIPALIVFLDKDKFGDKKVNKYIKLSLIIILILIVSKVISIFSNIGSSQVIHSSGEISPSTKQLQYLLNNPKYIFVVIYNTFYFKKFEYLVGLIGNFGWLRYNLDYNIIKLYYMFMIIVLLSDENKMKLKTKLCNLLFMGILVGGIFAAMYLNWSDYKLIYVEGVQGRYFLPLIPPVIISLIPNKKMINIKQEFVYSFINIVFMVFIVTLLVSFY